MDLEKTLDSSAGSASTPASAPAPKPGPEPGGDKGGDNITEISEHGDFNLSGLLLWICAVLALTGMIFLWFLNRSAAQKLTDKTNEKTTTIAEISSPTYAAVETKATAFQAAVNQLDTATKSRYMMSEFLPLLYGRVDKNVTVTNLAIDSTGKLSFDGKTDSYKSAALQLAALQGWKINDENVVTGAQLLSESEDVSKGTVVTFSISGTIDKTISLITTSASTTQGGN